MEKNGNLQEDLPEVLEAARRLGISLRRCFDLIIEGVLPEPVRCNPHDTNGSHEMSKEWEKQARGPNESAVSPRE